MLPVSSLRRSSRSVVVSKNIMLSSTLDTQCTDSTSENEPDLLADAFEQDAARREKEMDELWGSDCPKFKTEDPTRTSSFKGLDRTKIPANPDYLVNDPIGLEVFLRLAKHRTPSHPLSAIGLHPGPAFMSYGSAVAKYGPPEAPGEDWPSEDQLDDDVDRDGTAQDISSASDSETTSKLPLLSWALFKESSFLKYTSLLVAEYGKLVREKSS